MDTKELMHLTIQIEKLHKGGHYEDVSALLADLSHSPITPEHLQTTDIAKTVYQLLKSCHVSTVRNTAKALLSKWKQMYSPPHGHNSAKDTGQIKGCEVSESVPSAEFQLIDFQQHPSVSSDLLSSERTGLSEEAKETKPLLKTDDNKPAASVAKDRTGEDSQDPPQPSSSSDSTALRTKCVELFLQALTTDPRADPDDPNKLYSLAQSIEQHVHALHSQKQAKYKSCIRSRLANLKNPKNSHLRQGLLTGSLAPEVFARMSVEEMAGEELRRLREGYTAAAITEHQLPQGLEGMTTTKVRCRRCQGMNCRVTQVSRGTLFLPSWVRSDNTDEDTMTFLTCARCGEQWYHSRWVCL